MDHARHILMETVDRYAENSAGGCWTSREGQKSIAIDEQRAC